MGFADKLEKITEAKWYKVMMPKLYGWGASLVIIGALFKIEHRHQCYGNIFHYIL